MSSRRSRATDGRDYARGGEDYARAVVEGTIAAGKLARLACERQLRDLKRAEAGDPAFPYRFDEGAAARVCRFIELLPHVKGKWARVDPRHPTANKIRLEPWQVFILTTVFGWLHRETGMRRFTKVYEEVARKNAKSTKMSGVALYLFSADNEPGAEVYSAATKKDQAKIVFGDARMMALRSAEFRNKLSVTVQAHSLSQPATGSKLTALDAKGDTQDGLNVHGVILDELHAHRRRDLYDVLESATGSREQPLVWAITTAGSNRAGVCYELRGYVIKILERVLEDESVFGMIFTIDKEDRDNWRDETVWLKANPNLGVSKSLEVMRSEARKAAASPASLANFYTKHLDVWVNADQAWMDMQAWEACGDPALRLEDFAGCDCVLSADLAWKTDIASRIRLFERDGIVHLFAQHYLPRAAIEASGNAFYDGWAREGWITVHEGNVLDFDLIEQDIIADCDRFAVSDVAFDPAQAHQMMVRLAEKGLPVIKVGATVLNFSEPMKELDALAREGGLRHSGDPVLSWMVSNVVCHYDNKDNVYPRKERPENKIDGAVAAIMALARHLNANDEDAPVEVSYSRGDMYGGAAA